MLLMHYDNTTAVCPLSELCCCLPRPGRARTGSATCRAAAAAAGSGWQKHHHDHPRSPPPAAHVGSNLLHLHHLDPLLLLLSHPQLRHVSGVVGLHRIRQGRSRLCARGKEASDMCQQQQQLEPQRRNSSLGSIAERRKSVKSKRQPHSLAREPSGPGHTPAEQHWAAEAGPHRPAASAAQLAAVRRAVAAQGQAAARTQAGGSPPEAAPTALAAGTPSGAGTLPPWEEARTRACPSAAASPAACTPGAGSCPAPTAGVRRAWVGTRAAAAAHPRVEGPRTQAAAAGNPLVALTRWRQDSGAERRCAQWGVSALG